MAEDKFSAVAESQLASMKSSMGDLNAEMGQMEGGLKVFDKMATNMEKPVEKITALQEAMKKLGDSLQNPFSSGLRDAIKSGGDFTNMLDKLKSSIEDFVIQTAVIDPLKASLFGNGNAQSDNPPSMASGGLLGDLLSLFEGRAGGGPVSAGMPYLVGEKGPELFVPQVAGRIRANGDAQASAVHVTMNISTPDAVSFRASQSQIAARMMDGIRMGQRIR